MEMAAPIFKTEILKNIIRIHTHSQRNILSDFLEQSMLFFVAQQANLRDKPSPAFNANPWETWADLAKQNFEFWQTMTGATTCHPQTNNAKTTSDTAAPRKRRSRKRKAP